MIELVLLGHRLLRQAEVGEGAVAVFVEDEPRDAALSKLEQVREPFFDLDSTRLAAPADAPGHEHTSTVKLAVLVNLHGAEVLPLVKPPTPRRGHRGDALGAVGIELDVPDELDVDVRPIDSTDIAYSARPTASRASSSVAYSRNSTAMPSRILSTWVSGIATSSAEPRIRPRSTVGT